MSRVSRSPPLYIRNIISHLFMRVGLKHKFYRRMPFLSPNSRIAAPRGAECFYRDTITKLIIRQDSRGSAHPMSVCHHWAVVLICIGDHCTNYHTQCRVDSSARHLGLLQTPETFAEGKISPETTIQYTGP